MEEGKAKNGLHPWRKLGNNAALLEEDWRAVYLAHQAFVYQVRRIVAEAEERSR